MRVRRPWLPLPLHRAAHRARRIAASRSMLPRWRSQLRRVSAPSGNGAAYGALFVVSAGCLGMA